MRSEKLIVALDVADEKEAKALVRSLKKDVSVFKVGLQLYTAAGPQIIKAIQKSDHKVMLDLKYHDIPTTVAKAVMEATKLEVFMLTLHALGGKEMMERAVEAAQDTAEKLSLHRPRLVAVTIPTSRQDIGEIGIGSSIQDEVVRLATLAKEAGCDGVVCSPHEIEAVRQALSDDFILVVPGIRLGGDEEDDQKRIATPQATLAAGADYIVVGRPILRAADPVQAVQKINAQIHGIEYQEPPAPEPAPETEQAEKPKQPDLLEQPEQPEQLEEPSPIVSLPAEVSMPEIPPEEAPAPEVAAEEPTPIEPAPPEPVPDETTPTEVERPEEAPSEAAPAPEPSTEELNKDPSTSS